MELLYADKRIAVAVKPPGVLSTDEPGGMPELLRAQLGTPCIRTVHRLDAATGGVMVFARSAAAASILSGQVREHRFRKIYLAVVRGDPGQGGIWRDMLGRDPVRRVTYIAREPGKDVRPAELSYETLAVREGLSLVRVTLHTGRTHQIRVQFAGRGFPLVGDRKYGGAGDGEALALWAWRLGFTHGSDVSVDADGLLLNLPGGGGLAQVQAGIHRPGVGGGHPPEGILDDHRGVVPHPQLQKEELLPLAGAEEAFIPLRLGRPDVHQAPQQLPLALRIPGRLHLPILRPLLQQRLDKKQPLFALGHGQPLLSITCRGHFFRTDRGDCRRSRQ